MAHAQDKEYLQALAIHATADHVLRSLRLTLASFHTAIYAAESHLASCKLQTERVHDDDAKFLQAMANQGIADHVLRSANASLAGLQTAIMAAESHCMACREQSDRLRAD